MSQCDAGGIRVFVSIDTNAMDIPRIEDAREFTLLLYSYIETIDRNSIEIAEWRDHYKRSHALTQDREIENKTLDTLIRFSS